VPGPDEIVGNDPQWLLARAHILTAQGQTQEARAVTERALALDSLLARGYGQLADSYAVERDLGGIAASIARGLAVEPRFAVSLRQFEAGAYESAGQPELALAALERGIPRGPFSRPENVLQSVEELRARVAAR
jgi:tetratricopeptide (TPR) repeat protein